MVCRPASSTVPCGSRSDLRTAISMTRRLRRPGVSLTPSGESRTVSSGRPLPRTPCSACFARSSTSSTESIRPNASVEHPRRMWRFEQRPRGESGKPTLFARWSRSSAIRSERSTERADAPPDGRPRRSSTSGWFSKRDGSPPTPICRRPPSLPSSGSRTPRTSTSTSADTPGSAQPSFGTAFAWGRRAHRFTIARHPSGERLSPPRGSTDVVRSGMYQ